MASRRAPLANVPNAVNSPFRNLAATGGKRTRAADAVYGQPPAKKQVIEIVDDDGENLDPKRRSGVAIGAQDKVDEPFSRRSNAPPTAFERKLAAARERKPSVQQQPHRSLKDAQNIDSIRQWQKHYRKQFPSFVIYFDNVPDDVRSRTVRQIQSLGAREEKFFSKAVTHVVTTRQIPPEHSNTTPDDAVSQNTAQQRSTQSVTTAHGSGRTTSLLDAHLHRRNQAHSTTAAHDVDPRRTQTQGADILSRARQLGIKIWALEKLHRMLSTILESEADDQVVTRDTRSHTVGKTVTKAPKDADLEMLLRNEKVNGPADRDMATAAPDVTTFRGYYIYIHDMDEKTKPVMTRDYPKPKDKENSSGKWPQFRLTSAGRCPFVEDPNYTKKAQQQEQAAKAQEELASRKTRAASAQVSGAQRIAPPLRPLTERQHKLRRSPRKVDALAKPLDPPPAKRNSSAEMPPLFGSAQQGLRGLPRMIGGEPIASGVQHSNVTSAIRSQYISSAAISSTAPGASHRVADTKEVSMLKRKVLERGASVNSNHSIPSSYMNDMRAALNNNDEPPPRAAKRKAQETLGVLREDDEEGQSGRHAKQRKLAKPRVRKPVERDPKPGYCENCHDKFDDFEEHCQTRKHRRFATTQDNWKELDELLFQLKRPHKDE
ncbi:zinc finger protein [Teratosphaeria destructans]|uniref:Zinc finger protein n=1 Tax=Teratosphaeria destructans TaxID=418781 RepID=A0A9W7SSJ5_9PEZI|nr:zinc finger protein [Teratosphaeria destructans]